MQLIKYAILKSTTSSSIYKDCRVSSRPQGLNADSTIDIEKMYLLSEFTYELEKSNAQTFNVLDSGVFGLINMVRLDFTSNHGSPSHICIYRFRVHGHELDLFLRWKWSRNVYASVFALSFVSFYVIVQCILFRCRIRCYELLI